MGIGRPHGTADRPAERLLAVAARAAADGLSDQEAAAKVVAEMRERRERMPGFHLADGAAARSVHAGARPLRGPGDRTLD
ncbi:hypothetical protein [Nonomuraea dietziae]|uniref:hypothetical protein n=1 Tax=Nonomuraea dietziae TaxID=65515 RepID=UPI00341BF418